VSEAQLRRYESGGFCMRFVIARRQHILREPFTKTLGPIAQAEGLAFIKRAEFEQERGELLDTYKARAQS
jgi:hypothetical protein